MDHGAESAEQLSTKTGRLDTCAAVLEMYPPQVQRIILDESQGWDCHLQGAA